MENQNPNQSLDVNPDLENSTLPQSPESGAPAARRGRPAGSKNSPKTNKKPAKKSPSRGPRFRQNPQRGLGSSPVDEQLANSDRQDPQSSKASSNPLHIGQGQAKLSPEDREALEAIIKKAVTTTTFTAADFLIKDPMARENELFVTTDSEAQGIASPAASMIARRGVGAGTADSDLADLVTMAFTFFAYLIRNLELRRAIKQVQFETYVEQTQNATASQTQSTFNNDYETEDLPSGGFLDLLNPASRSAPSGEDLPAPQTNFLRPPLLPSL